jgi:hypothetical protein
VILHRSRPNICGKGDVAEAGERLRLVRDSQRGRGRLPADYSAVGNRDAGWVLTIMASWDDPAQDAPNIEWARTAWQRMRSFSTGGTYINFLTEDETQERVETALGPALRRLGEVKAKWDPQNVFRANRNIEPA